MVVSRLFGKVALSGTVRKQVSQAVYKEYSQAVRQLEKAGALKGVKAELKLKAKNSLLGKGTDYVQLAYKDASGNIQKLALDKRNADVSVKDYLETAIQKAKNITGNSIKSKMPKSKKYEQFTQALKDNKDLFGNLPEKATVTFERASLTGRKTAVVSVPVTDKKGVTTHYLTQTLKKGRGQDMGAFVQEATEQANLVFENTINPKGLLSARQIQEQAKHVQASNKKNAVKGLKRDWNQALGQARNFSSETPKTEDAAKTAIDRVEESFKRVEKRIARQQQFNYVNREFKKLDRQLAASPSRNKRGVNLAQEKQKTYDVHSAMKNSMHEKYTKSFLNEIKEGKNKFKQAQEQIRQEAREKAEEQIRQQAESNNTSGFFTSLFEHMSGG